MRSDRGSILILVALSMTVILSIAALSLDASLMYDMRNRLYAAADAAAKIGAAEVKRNQTVSTGDLEQFAYNQVAAHGLTPGACGTTTIGVASVCVHHPPTISVPFNGNMGYVEVVVEQRTATTGFGQWLNVLHLTPGARAVAGTGEPLNCLSVSDDLHIGSTILTMPGCDVAVGGNLYGDVPPATISPSSTDVNVSGVWNGVGDMAHLTTGAAAPVDPLASLPTPVIPGPCLTPSPTATSLTAGCYTTVPDTVTSLGPGMYQITGDFFINHPGVTGNGVFLYLTGAGRFIATPPGGTKALHLTAMTSGPYQGIVIWQDVGDTNNFETNPNFTLDFNGAIYMPGSDVHFNNSINFTSSGCAVFIAKSLTIDNGHGSLNTTGCAAAYGGAAYLSISMAE